MDYSPIPLLTSRPIVTSVYSMGVMVRVVRGEVYVFNTPVCYFAWYNDGCAKETVLIVCLPLSSVLSLVYI